MCCETWPKKAESTDRHAPPEDKKELQACLGLINYLGTLSPSTADICESWRKITSARTEWTWNVTHQKIFDKAKSIIKDDACMKFYDDTKLLYIETDVPGAGLGAALLQTRSSTSCPRDEVPESSIPRTSAFMSKRLLSVEKWYSSIVREVLGLQNGLKKFHHYCFTREVSIIVV